MPGAEHDDRIDFAPSDKSSAIWATDGAALAKAGHPWNMGIADLENAMPGFDYDLFVIGGGSGGVRAARIASAEGGARVGLAEESRMGGHLCHPRLRAQKADGLCLGIR